MAYEQPVGNSGTLMGTLSGTLLVVILNIRSADVLRTATLAAVGAVVSFAVSLCLKRLAGYIARRGQKRCL